MAKDTTLHVVTLTVVVRGLSEARVVFDACTQDATNRPGVLDYQCRMLDDEDWSDDES